jgi:hypothetical protein
MSMTLEKAAAVIEKLEHDGYRFLDDLSGYDESTLIAYIASAITQAENEAEQRAIDRCRQIISRAIAGDNADAESMRRLLLAAFDPAWDRVSSIIKSQETGT